MIMHVTFKTDLYLHNISDLVGVFRVENPSQDILLKSKAITAHVLKQFEWVG